MALSLLASWSLRSFLKRHSNRCRHATGLPEGSISIESSTLAAHTRTRPMVELSVVLITKNQAWNIARLIESVLDATSSVLSKEIILVDSASTDQTVEIAGRYPVTILR